MKSLILVFLAGFFYQRVDAAIVLSEARLLELAKEHAPTLDMIKSSLMSAQTQRNLNEEKFAPEIFGKASYAENHERPLIEFIPIFSPIKQAQLGVRQKFTKGFEAELAATTDQRSANSRLSGRYNNVTTTVLSLTVQMDLWRDLFGRVSQAEKESMQMEAKKAELEERINRRAFQISLRKIYWMMVANQEQLKIAQSLKDTAGQQVADSKRRFKNAIGDRGEVARYEAQAASRSGQVIYLMFQREGLISQLKNLLPALGPEELVLDGYDLSKTIQEVLTCTGIINQKLGVPYEYTEYDEVVTLLREIKNQEKTVNQRYSDVDIKLFGTVKATGVASDKVSDTFYRGSYSDSNRDMTNGNRTGYEAGVMVNIPLGSAKANTKTTKSHYDELRLKAAIDQSEAQVVSSHGQLIKSIGFISEVIKTQKLSTEALEIRLKEIRKQFTQARISVNDLILDQDALLSSQLLTINAQTEALSVLLDYLMIFTETPCTFNRI